MKNGVFDDLFLFFACMHTAVHGLCVLYALACLFYGGAELGLGGTAGIAE